MKILKPFLLTIIISALSLSISAQSKTNINVQVDPKTGNYSISASSLEWTMSGSIGQPLKNLKKNRGSDSIGDYNALSFEWEGNYRYIGSIRWYAASQVVLFSLTTPDGTSNQPVVAF